MPHRAHLSQGERHAVSRLRQLLTQPGVLHGSIQLNRRRCGKPNCRCTRGKLHASPVVWVMREGRQTALRIPAAWEARVREWVQRDREIRELLLELSTLYTERLRRRKE